MGLRQVRGLVVGLVLGLLTAPALSAQVVLDMASESFAASEQAHGRLMNTALEVALSPDFAASGLVMSNPVENAWTFIMEGVASYRLWEDLGPWNWNLGVHGGLQLINLPRLSTNDLMGTTPWTFAPGSLAFSVSETFDAMNFFGGLSLFSADGRSYLVGGLNLGVEFEEVDTRVSPYLFTNFEILPRLRSFLLAGLSSSVNSLFSRLGGGLDYSFAGLIPALPGSVPGDLQVGVQYVSNRLILSTQTIWGLDMTWYPWPGPGSGTNGGGQDGMNKSSGTPSLDSPGGFDRLLNLQLGFLGDDYDYREDEQGFYAKVSLDYDWITVGLNFLPPSLLLDQINEIPAADQGQRHLGWQIGLLYPGGIASLSIQYNYLVNDSFAAPLVGTTIALFFNPGALLQDGWED